MVEQVPLVELHAMMLAGRSGKPPAKLKAKDFLATIEEAYRREQAWRATL